MIQTQRQEAQQNSILISRGIFLQYPWEPRPLISTLSSSVAPRPWFNIKMPTYQYRKSHGGISYTGKMTSFNWISPQKFTTTYTVTSMTTHLTSWRPSHFIVRTMIINVTKLTLKRKLCHFDVIFVTSCTSSYQNDTLLCSQCQNFVKMTFPFHWDTANHCP